MRHFNAMSYYSVPRRENGPLVPKWLAIELGILGARLYFNFDEYADLLEYLKPKGAREVAGGLVNGNRAAAPAEGLSEFLLEWLSIRRKGQDIMQSPLGYVCQGKPLDDSHPFFAEAQGNDQEVDAMLAARMATLTTADAGREVDSEDSE